MEPITLPKASLLTSPNPVVLACTTKPDGSPNLATVSWWTYLSYHPDMAAFAMAKPSYTGERVRETKEAVLAVPGAAIARAVMGCGSTTGRRTDKAERFGIKLMPVPESAIAIPVHTRAALVCDLKEYHETGDHYLYICTVRAVYGNEAEEALFAWNGYAEVRPAK